jgi:hypothetical protein
MLVHYLVAVVAGSVGSLHTSCAAHAALLRLAANFALRQSWGGACGKGVRIGGCVVRHSLCAMAGLR